MKSNLLSLTLTCAALLAAACTDGREESPTPSRQDALPEPKPTNGTSTKPEVSTPAAPAHTATAPDRMAPVEPVPEAPAPTATAPATPAPEEPAPKPAMPAGTEPAALEPAAPAAAGPAAGDGAIAPPAKDAAATASNLAPDFTLPDTNGKSHKLSEYRGKVVILEWVNHGCPFVQKHYGSGNMQALQKQAAEKGAVWLSICSSADGKQGHMTAEKWNEEIAATKTAAAAVLLDPAGDVGRLYEAKTTPQMFVLDTEGRIVYRGAIDDKPTSDQADIAGAKNYVTEALDAVLAGKPVETAETKPYGCSVKYAAPTR